MLKWPRVPQKDLMSKQFKIGALIVVIILGLGVWRYAAVAKELKNTKIALNTSTESYEAKIKDLQNTVDLAIKENADLHLSLNEEKDRNDSFEEQINELSGTVGKLDKLSKTDKELLQKYSKIYFLNEHYIPERLTDISSTYVFNNTDKHPQIHAKVKPFFEKMLDAAKDENVDPLVISAYRSFNTQASLKTSYKVTYGTGANAFSADQGYSEHQLGTTIDFTSKTLGASFEGFENTPEYKWLKENAYKYGFVLSYPKNNAYYQFEPWHWRFVGKDLAKKLHSDGKYFYDMDQRDIDKFLIEIFDN